MDAYNIKKLSLVNIEKFLKIFSASVRNNKYQESANEIKYDYNNIAS